MVVWVCFLRGATGASEELTGRCIEVVDADTLRVELGNGDVAVVHLFGIDAPELGQPFGDAAAAATLELVGEEVELAVRVRRGD
jgi:endonuclease YncB( thermonuclease family)